MHNWLRRLILGKWLYTAYLANRAVDKADQLSEVVDRELAYLHYCTDRHPEKWDNQYIRTLCVQADFIAAVEQVKAYNVLLKTIK